ncbi:hypothetical protein RCG23_12740 [Neobacillus sp. PS3-34]|uniref:hypothetical protein n=1 Tax=Neobacillus sp. PS3-34 TaxID=3070678 RepID=UPI0027E05436|nr:hypothetical protein [Neobacillus sp. PS3-34]WML46543.1 hypothetical protein RCG23_12740 [Neobacillus sp. PS3-34]
MAREKMKGIGEIIVKTGEKNRKASEIISESREKNQKTREKNGEVCEIALKERLFSKRLLFCK